MPLGIIAENEGQDKWRVRAGDGCQMKSVVIAQSEVEIRS